MKLREIAHSRSGDKGDISNISLIVYDPENYDLIRRTVTAARVSAHFEDIVHGEVVRYEMPTIGALNFVLRNALGGGVIQHTAPLTQFFDDLATVMLLHLLTDGLHDVGTA